MQRIYVALDLELTGLDPQRDEIIEIGLVRFQGTEVLETLTSLVNTRRPIPLKIQQLTGITQEQVAQAPPLRQLYGKIIAFVKSHPVVGHNVEMDLRLLSRQGLPLNNLALDTFELASILFPYAERYTLSSLAHSLGIDLPHAHRALDDAQAAKDLFLNLLARAESYAPEVITEIARLAEHSDWPFRQVFADLAPLAHAPLFGSVAERRRTDSHVRTLRPEEELAPLQPSRELAPLDVDALSALISPGGVVASAFPGYEHRPQQVQMLRAVSEAFNIPAHLLVEAGTGTGKSLAYLLPAVHFATQNGRRVVVSSNTINLQDQLYTKDIPDLQRILPNAFSAALLKGRGNYLCQRRLAIFRRSRQLTSQEMRFAAKILAWLPTTGTGDRSELTLVNEDQGYWSQVQSDSPSCMGDACPYRQREDCFFQRARSRAERAHLVIVNHALLLSDTVLENRILPDYQYLIIDEAHHLEEQATDQFGFRVGRQDIYSFLNGLYHQANAAPSGLLAELPRLAQRDGVSDSARDALSNTLLELQPQIDHAEGRLSELFHTIEEFLRNHTTLRTAARDAYDQTFPLTPGMRAQPDWSQVEVSWESFSAAMQQVVRGLERLYKLVQGLGSGEDAEREEVELEIASQQQHASELCDNLAKILTEPDTGGIYWIAVSSRDEQITLNSAPLSVAPLLQESLFSKTDCVVLTSATLRAGNSFGFIKQRLGLEDPLELALDSPFNFQTASLLYVPKDIPEPNEPNYQRTVEQAIVDVCTATEGRTLVLFTSNSQLHTTYRAVEAPLEQEDIVVFAQGIDGSRRQILDSFRTTPRSVLMGTRSFWEGVDVVGQALSCLVIPRLPFAVPTDPVLAARAQTFDDPFNQFYLPDSILRFRQGFGRLIRSRDDYGLVVVLDRRILTKPYGKVILRSLPPCTARQGPLQALPSVAKRWLDRSLRDRT